MDKNIVSFIESIEPDFSYQGNEGAMALIVESNDNMLIIENYLDSIDAEIIQEGLYTSAKDKGSKVYEWAKEKAKKAIDYIIKAIKVAIAKIKSLFFQMVKKVKVLYAQAMNKIGSIMSKVASKDIEGIKVSWKKLDDGMIGNLVNNFNPAELPEVKNMKASAGAADDESVKALDSSEDMTAKKVLARCTKGIAKVYADSDAGIAESIKGICLVEQGEISGGVEGLKSTYNKVIEHLKNLYDKIMKNEASMLKTVSELRKEADRNSVSYANKVVNAVNSACTMFFNAIFGVVVTGLHQRIKAVVYAIKHRAGKAYDSAKTKAGEAYDSVKTKAGNAYDSAKKSVGDAAGKVADTVKDAIS